jgi:hypothetical protein
VDIRNAKTALEAWTTLKENYQTDGDIGIIIAIRQLFSTRANVDDDMQKHLRTMKSCAEELCTFGYPLADPVLSLMLFTSMPDEWDSWVSSAALDEELLKKPSKVNAAILMEARRRSPAPDSVKTESTALVAHNKHTAHRRHPVRHRERGVLRCPRGALVVALRRPQLDRTKSTMSIIATRRPRVALSDRVFEC